MLKYSKKTKYLLIVAGFLGSIFTHHRVKYGRWWDEKIKCHGKIGAATLASSLFAILTYTPKVRAK